VDAFNPAQLRVTQVETSEQSFEPISMERAMKQVDGDTEFIKDLLEMFFSSVPLQVTQLRLGIKNNDAEQVRQVAGSRVCFDCAVGRSYQTAQVVGLDVQQELDEHIGTIVGGGKNG